MDISQTKYNNKLGRRRHAANGGERKDDGGSIMILHPPSSSIVSFINYLLFIITGGRRKEMMCPYYNIYPHSIYYNHTRMIFSMIFTIIIIAKKVFCIRTPAFVFSRAHHFPQIPPRCCHHPCSLLSLLPCTPVVVLASTSI